MSVYTELKRRNVFRVAAAYIVVGWLFLQVADIVLDFVSAPEWVGKAIIALLVLSFIPALAVAWIFEVTPDGVKRDDGTLPETNGHQAKRLDVITIGAVVVLAVMMFWQQLSPREEFDRPAATAQNSTEKSDQTSPATSTSTSNTRQASNDPDAIIAPENSIAVLPFANRSSQADTQFFVDGVHDDLLTQLARIGELKVISRTSVMEYRDTTKNLRQIGQELGVATLLEGAVQRAGNRVRINAQLIDANTDEHLWADTFDRELSPENIFEIQSDIAGAIARALTTTLSDEEIAVSKVSAPTQNLDAYDLYLQARAIPPDGTPQEVRRAIDLSKKAVELDPNFALAMGEVGYGYTNSYWFETRDEEERDEGRRWLERALALAPDEPRLNYLWANHLYHGYLDYQGSLAALAKAQRISPNDAAIYGERSWILRRSGDYHGAIREMKKAIQLDPRDVLTMAYHIETFIHVDDFESARRWGQRVQSFSSALPRYQILAVEPELKIKGNTTPTRKFLETYGNEPLVSYETIKFELPFYERRYDDALAALDDLPDPLTVQYAIWPHSYVRALIHLAKDETDAAQRLARQSLDEIDKLTAERGEDHRLLMSRAFMFGVLGNKKKAEAHLARAASLDSVRLDALRQVGVIAESLRVRAVYLDSDELAKVLGEYLARPIKSAYIDYLFLDPVFDRHRQHPAIKALEEKYSRRVDGA